MLFSLCSCSVLVHCPLFLVLLSFLNYPLSSLPVSLRYLPYPVFLHCSLYPLLLSFCISCNTRLLFMSSYIVLSPSPPFPRTPYLLIWFLHRFPMLFLFSYIALFILSSPLPVLLSLSSLLVFLHYPLFPLLASSCIALSLSIVSSFLPMLPSLSSLPVFLNGPPYSLSRLLILPSQSSLPMLPSLSSLPVFLQCPPYSLSRLLVLTSQSSLSMLP